MHCGTHSIYALHKKLRIFISLTFLCSVCSFPVSASRNFTVLSVTKLNNRCHFHTKFNPKIVLVQITSYSCSAKRPSSSGTITHFAVTIKQCLHVQKRQENSFHVNVNDPTSYPPETDPPPWLPARAAFPCVFGKFRRYC